MITDILKSFIVPSKMKKYRFMSVLIAILIFIVGIYMISFPNNIYIKNHKEQYLQQKSYVNCYYDMSSSGSVDKITSRNYTVKNNIMTSSVENEGINVSTFNYLFNEKEVTTYVVFDINNTLEASVVELRDDILKLYPDFEASTALQIADIVYSEKHSSSDDVSVLIEKYAKYSQDELSKEMEKITYTTLLGLDDSNEYTYLVIFFKEYVLSQVPYFETADSNVEYHALSTGYSQGATFDFSEVTSSKDLGLVICEGMFPALLASEQTQYLITVAGYVLVYPIILVFLMWLMMRKRGVMKTFKEYYNVASISAIVPIIITFIVSWFVPNIVMLFGALFSIYSLFTFISINSKPELGD